MGFFVPANLATNKVADNPPFPMILAYTSGALLLMILGAYSYTRYKRHSLIAKSTNAKEAMPNYTFRHADADDIEVIRNLALEIWPKTYNGTYSPQQVIYMLNQLFSEASLRKQMLEKHQYSIVYAGSYPIGFTAYSEIQASLFKLHKIYLLPSFQGLGAGKFTMNKIIEEITLKNASALVLNVNKHNPAIAFYEHLGFQIAKTENTEVGNGFFTHDYVMELKLPTQKVNPRQDALLQLS